MGIIADIFITTTEQAKGLDDTSALPDADVANYGRMTELEMGFIKQLLLGQPLAYDPDLGFEAINVVDGGERITTKFPDDMIPMLANIDEPTIQSVATGLAQTEEMCCNPEDVTPVLQDLKRLAISAQERSLNLFLWNCV